MKREVYRYNQIASLLMFGRRENKYKKVIRVTWSGKRYRVDTKNISHGNDLKNFIETNFSPLFSGSKSKGEESHPDNP